MGHKFVRYTRGMLNHDRRNNITVEPKIMILLSTILSASLSLVGVELSNGRSLTPAQ